MKFRKFSLAFVIVVLLIFHTDTNAENVSVEVPSWPTDLSSFDSFRNERSTTPEGALLSLIAALDLYSKNKEDGIKALILVVDSSHLNEDSKGYKGFSLNRNLIDLVKRQIEQHPYLISSYLPGSSLSNGYQPSQPPYTFSLNSNRFGGSVESGERKLFVPSSGADSERPVTLKRNSKGVWKAKEFSSLLVGIRKPAGKNSADDL
ncbi:hypothetical protein EHQ12_13995 [Leptospira gomenensis]|uniref:DUF6935 domain-containing protein n=1 Tax=Leptospira gomenensis TaxID=2484974 RepID=A0A5F1YR53_9LEPT|nr:hypothetical protein [Leptospira gomenensis]TGK27979.1 hypothetical protein EHQ17_17970 [Leptospira gomenensis]TGK37166.1 hypothetical protein EHQ12_13995 [Leptospira gomenensis]TGK45802.1 hypothetical protein EHQ07_09005 [Leptospira gomenensis]TGK59741.1 hypothetical protein EHQ13_13215 [Leptospira gomenensis]